MTGSILLIHPNGKSRRIRPGFCWMGFFLTTLWAISEGLWRPFAFSLLGWQLTKLSIVLARYFDSVLIALFCPFAYPAVMVFFGIYGKRWLVADMMRNGYVASRLAKGL